MRREAMHRSGVGRRAPLSASEAGGRLGAGFTLIELLVVISIVAVLVSLLLPWLARSRATARLGVCLSNNAQLARAGAAYAVDFQDRMFAFSWKKGSTNGASGPAAGGLVNATTDLQAAANQAVYIIRTRADRPTFPVLTSWIPHVMFTHLVLVDYLAARLPEPMLVCPEDYWRRKWQDVQCYNRGEFLPYQLQPADSGLRGPYVSSYEVPPCTYDKSPAGFRVNQQGGNFCQYYVPSEGVLGGRKVSEVASPAGKVMLMDQFDRHGGARGYYYAHTPASSTLAFFDGSVRRKRTERANAGWQPNDPLNPQPTLVSYNPAVQTCYPAVPDPINPSGDVVKGYYRWTRGGLRGVDFGGEEVRGTEN